MKAADFTSISIDIANNHKTHYMLGAFGQTITADFIRQKAAQLPGWYTSSKQAELRALVGTGTKAFDCVGLIKAILWGWPAYGYAVNGVPDIDETAMINRCSGVSTDFSNIAPGEVVWLPGHIGIYIGNGLAVECTPSWANKVQITAVANIGSRAGYNARRWTKHGRLPWIDYSGQTSAGPLRVGDRVRLGADSTIYGSKSKFAPWVYNAVLYLREIKGDRAVVSTQQSGAVTGATQLSRLKRA